LIYIQLAGTNFNKGLPRGAQFKKLLINLVQETYFKKAFNGYPWEDQSSFVRVILSGIIRTGSFPRAFPAVETVIQTRCHDSDTGFQLASFETAAAFPASFEMGIPSSIRTTSAIGHSLSPPCVERHNRLYLNDLLPTQGRVGVERIYLSSPSLTGAV
jgi:hypothetical protein